MKAKNKSFAIFWTLCTQRIWCDGKIISQLRIETEVKSNLSFNEPMQFSKWNKSCDISCKINRAVWIKVTPINMSKSFSQASSEFESVISEKPSTKAYRLGISQITFTLWNRTNMFLINICTMSSTLTIITRSHPYDHQRVINNHSFQYHAES